MHNLAMSVFEVLTSLGYLGIALGLMIEIIPSEIVLAYGGYLLSQGKISLMGAIIAGVIGGTIAQLFIYWIGRYGGRPFLERFGKLIGIKRNHIDLSEQWFNRYGPGVIFSARFIPIVRHAISIPAGIAKMSQVKFTLYTVSAIIPWSILFIMLGEQLGGNWQRINEVAAPYVKQILIVAVIILVIYFGFKLMIKKKRNNK
jgi:membrane protein DedA with SNARE-associated domain